MRSPRPPTVPLSHQQRVAEGTRGRHHACAEPGSLHYPINTSRWRQRAPAVATAHARSLATCSTRFPPAGGGRGRPPAQPRMRNPRPPAVPLSNQQVAAEGARERHRACAETGSLQYSFPTSRWRQRAPAGTTAYARRLAACSSPFPPAGGGRGRPREGLSGGLQLAYCAIQSLWLYFFQLICYPHHAWQLVLQRILSVNILFNTGMKHPLLF